MVTSRISAVILTKNEAINIERCLCSLNWCDEIVVLDSGSTDETTTIAESMEVKVFTHVQPPPFRIANQRNWALEHCGLIGDWILFVDADETIPEALASEIKTQIQAQAQEQGLTPPQGSTTPQINAFELTPRYLFWGQWLKRTQGYPNWHARLLKREEVRFAGGVWEHFDDGAEVGRISIPYDHHANSKGFSDWLERHDRYSSWDAKSIIDFLNHGKSEALGTTRKLRLRQWAAQLWPLRPLARFFQMYVLRLGFLEGWRSLVFCSLYALYELMIVTKVIELKRQKAGLPL